MVSFLGTQYHNKSRAIKLGSPGKLPEPSAYTQRHYWIEVSAFTNHRTCQAVIPKPELEILLGSTLGSFLHISILWVLRAIRLFLRVFSYCYYIPISGRWEKFAIFFFCSRRLLNKVWIIMQVDITSRFIKYVVFLEFLSFVCFLSE
jgi:hypothetical protein